ncbi:energy-coupling factor transporter ATPase [Tepidimicrobium xylanilyticum]|uniref:Energy-coupling factor transport system ATP-binding protein n=1 Tax=Tepidimicrobium xylanilyticum TaxID=1123352 RepID=A0A1H2VJF6_9FIRM|nr:energy-coupling factor transporter ATPase [Tepidimicrobium xylanilyticum]GMG97856.1 energy-coupling factor transporter ATP-binding protein EcfA [Tepidimicrobium xylanilyticum]SDW68472.1 energy-coupling factor transport system ATP-binding protein [Tepidimicrobium xylanilyticum]
MSEDIIRIENVTYKYNSVGEDSQLTAIKDINISVKKGEYLVILGHNGSGKSTLAKLMNGLLLPTRGDVYVKNMNTKDANKIWEIRETAGMVFQNPDNQIVATIVEEDVAFGPENQGIPPKEIRKRVDEALEIVEMSEYKKHAPHLLSGGQKQRVAIAGILAMRPECIILDEPTAMLDPIGRIEIINTIMKLNREEKKTIVHITHFMDEAVEADRILIMEQGKIVMEGSPREIFSQVEKVKSLGLDVPQVTELAFELRKEGIDIPTDILTIEELVKALC